MANPRTAQPSDPDYLKEAFSVLGLSEIEGRRHEKKVLAMYAASGHPEIQEDEVPWCAAYIGWCLKEGGLANTKSLLAISYAKYGTKLDPKEPIPRGAIAVWRRTGGNHVNFILEDQGKYVLCMGGNQENGRGGGVTISRRLKAGALAFRTPVAKPSIIKTIKDSKIAKAGVVVATASVGETLLKVNDTATQVSTIKDTADQVGVTDVLMHLITSPRFLVTCGVIIVVALIVYWRWKDHA